MGINPNHKIAFLLYFERDFSVVSRLFWCSLCPPEDGTVEGMIESSTIVDSSSQTFLNPTNTEGQNPGTATTTKTQIFYTSKRITGDSVRWSLITAIAGKVQLR
jgi:hypothetical protein